MNTIKEVEDTKDQQERLKHFKEEYSNIVNKYKIYYDSKTMRYVDMLNDNIYIIDKY